MVNLRQLSTLKKLREVRRDLVEWLKAIYPGIDFRKRSEVTFALAVIGRSHEGMIPPIARRKKYLDKALVWISFYPRNFRKIASHEYLTSLRSILERNGFHVITMDQDVATIVLVKEEEELENFTDGMRKQIIEI